MFKLDCCAALILLHIKNKNVWFYVVEITWLITSLFEQGTTRPTHYHVLHDELGFSADDLQELVHSLSYV
jgi:hypothetical protein